MKRINLSVLIFLCFSSATYACEHLPLGTPKDSDFVKCRKGYAIGYNYQLKSAEWVSYLLLGTNEDGVDREDDFQPDPDIPEEYRTYPTDYEDHTVTETGDVQKYHKGHLANSESVDTTRIANLETFYMSNMTPQLSGHNLAIWKGLENRERKWALERKLVLVMAGPLYLEDSIQTIGKNQVPIPTHYWKVIYDMRKGDAIGFLIPHKPLKTDQLNNYFESIDAIESKSGLDLLSSLPDDIEGDLEVIKAAKQW